MQYPLDLSFKILALGPQVAVTDASGSLVLYVKQKLFRLKEEITVFADREQTRALYTLKADRVIDFSARYTFTDSSGAILGSVKRQGMKSLWKTHYDIFEGDRATHTIRERNPWVKVADGLFEAIPLVGMFSGYVFHPSYDATREDGTVLMTLTKQPAFLEGKFRIEMLFNLPETEERRLLLAFLMMILLERGRG
jgi:uncharacterized protein YxjI